jgi:hypothetical protein
MRLNVPFVYNATGVLAGSRKPSTFKVVDSVELDIRELSADEARLAVHVKDGRRRYHGDRERTGPILDLDIRVFDGRMMRVAELCVPSRGAAGDGGFVHAPWDAATVETSQAIFDLWRQRPDLLQNCPLGETSVCGGGEFKDAARLRWREKHFDNRDETIAEIRALADGAAFVDGVLWTATKGPAWYVHRGQAFFECPFGENGVDAVRMEVLPEVYSLKGVFPIAEADRAEQYARRLVDETGLRFISQRHNVTSYPASLAGPNSVVADSLLDAANGLLRFMRESLGDYSPDTIRAYADLKQAVALWSKNIWPDDMRAAIDTVDRTEAAWVEERRRRAVEVGPGFMDKFRDAMNILEGRETIVGGTELGADDLRAIGLMK